jgi:MFS family permease
MKPKIRESGARSEPLQLSWLFHRGFVWVWIWGALASMYYLPEVSVSVSVSSNVRLTFGTVMSFNVALYSLAIFATDALDLSQTSGVIVQSLLAAGLVVGRPLAGLLLDKFGRINIAIVLSILNGVSCCAIWFPARSFTALATFALVQGAAGGAVWSAAAPVAAFVVGVEHLGSAMAMFWLSLVIPVFVGNPLAVLLLEYSRNQLGRSGPDAYAVSIIFCGGLSIAAGFCLYGSKWYLQGSPKLLHKV